jgi:hypothetical protein
MEERNGELGKGRNGRAERLRITAKKIREIILVLFLPKFLRIPPPPCCLIFFLYPSFDIGEADESYCSRDEEEGHQVADP